MLSVDLLGDTNGTDISDDANPSGDTSVRRIDLGAIQVHFTDQLTGS